MDSTMLEVQLVPINIDITELQVWVDHFDQASTIAKRVVSNLSIFYQRALAVVNLKLSETAFNNPSKVLSRFNESDHRIVIGLVSFNEW